MDRPDDALLSQAAAGDTAAFGCLVTRHQDTLVRFAARMLSGDVSAGEDIAQEAFLRLWRVRATWKPEGKLRAWLIHTAFRLCLDQQKKQLPSLPLIETDSMQRQPDPALALSVKNAIQTLPETHRAVFVLSAYHGLTHDEIAEALCLPPGTVASRKHHAIRHLRHTLADWWETPNA
jgi:RNA polymerase sigma-70 factor, ECF subfamily